MVRREESLLTKARKARADQSGSDQPKQAAPAQTAPPAIHNN